MRCLVTGGSGFLGSSLVKTLLQHGHSVTVVLRAQPETYRHLDWLGSVRLIEGSLEDLQGWRSQLADGSIDVLFHLAWFGVTADFRDHSDQISTNVVGSLRLFDLARQIGCKHWIGLGSQAEYGPYDGILDEEVPTKPTTTYGIAKLSTGLLTEKMAKLSGMRYTWVRLLAAYGPEDNPKHLIPSVIRNVSLGNAMAMTLGEQIWDYLYVTDAVEALYRIALHEAEGVFNLGSGRAIQIRTLVELIRDMINPKAPVAFGAVPYRPDQVMRLEADIGRLQSATGWKPEVSLEEGLHLTVKHVQAEISDAMHA